MRCFDSEAGDVEFDDDTVMHQSVDRSDSGHCVLENLIPFAESEIAREQHAAEQQIEPARTAKTVSKEVSFSLLEQTRWVAQLFHRTIVPSHNCSTSNLSSSSLRLFNAFRQIDAADSTQSRSRASSNYLKACIELR